ncbi:MAG: S41 family peptidase [Armatimonadota bacterium]
MRTIHRIGIGLLVGLFFIAGYTARLGITARENVALLEQKAPALIPGTRIAAANLQGADINFQPIQTLYVVVQNLREHYVEQLTSKEEGLMTYDAMRAMLSSLEDPNTRFVDPTQRKLISDAEEGKFHGIGAMLGIKRIKSGDLTEEHLIIVAPIASGPAAQAGLQAGDDIIKVNGKIVLPFDPYLRANKFIKDNRNGKTDRIELRKQLESEQKRIDNGIAIMEARDMLQSEDDKPVELVVMRQGSPKEMTIKLKERKFTVAPVDSSIIDNGHLGYVKVNCLCKTTSNEFASAITDFKSKEVGGLVLDLRDTASGEVASAEAIGRLLEPGKKLGVLEKSRGRKSAIDIPEMHNALWSKPVVVLVNAGTARTSEMLAASLKENGVAKLVGEKTYGDSAYVTLIEQKDGSAVLMTTGKLLTSKGIDFTGKGISVDVASGSQDAQLNEAVKLLAGSGDRS